MHLSTVKSILNISCASSKCLIYDTEVHMLILYDEKDIKKEGMQEQMYNPPIFSQLPSNNYSECFRDYFYFFTVSATAVSQIAL